jgi:hypothetical protein
LELRQIYLPGCRSHHPNDAPQQTKTLTTKKRNKVPPSYYRSGKRREGPNVVADGDGIWHPPPGRERAGKMVHDLLVKLVLS